MMQASVAHRPYGSADEAFILDHWQVMSDKAMASVLKRSEHSVKRKRQELGCFRSGARTIDPEVAAKVAEMWPKHTTAHIGKALGMSWDTVNTVARKHGLPDRTAAPSYSCDPVPSPSRPRRFTAEQLAWARAHNGLEPEAGLILTMAKDKGAPA